MPPSPGSRALTPDYEFLPYTTIKLFVYVSHIFSSSFILAGMPALCSLSFLHKQAGNNKYILAGMPALWAGRGEYLLYES